MSNLSNSRYINRLIYTNVRNVAGQIVLQSFKMRTSFLLQASLFALAFSLLPCPVTSTPMSSGELSSTASAEPGAVPIIIAQPIPPPSLQTFQEPRPDIARWHFQELVDEMEGWDLHPRPRLSLPSAWSASGLDPSATTAFRHELLEQLYLKSLLYVGSRGFDGPVRDFYVTPLALGRDHHVYRSLQDGGLLNQHVQSFFGADSPSMILISSPAHHDNLRPMQLGLHGFAKLTPTDITMFRSELERSRRSRSLLDVITNVDPNHYLPIFPFRPHPL